MGDNQENNGSIIPITAGSLAKVNNSLVVTKKILSESIHEFHGDFSFKDIWSIPVGRNYGVTVGSSFVEDTIFKVQNNYVISRAQDQYPGTLEINFWDRITGIFKGSIILNISEYSELFLISTSFELISNDILLVWHVYTEKSLFDYEYNRAKLHGLMLDKYKLYSKDDFRCERVNHLQLDYQSFFKGLKCSFEFKMEDMIDSEKSDSSSSLYSIEIDESRKYLVVTSGLQTESHEVYSYQEGQGLEPSCGGLHLTVFKIINLDTLTLYAEVNTQENTYAGNYSSGIIGGYLVIRAIPDDINASMNPSGKIYNIDNRCFLNESDSRRLFEESFFHSIRLDSSPKPICRISGTYLAAEVMQDKDECKLVIRDIRSKKIVAENTLPLVSTDYPISCWRFEIKCSEQGVLLAILYDAHREKNILFIETKSFKILGKLNLFCNEGSVPIYLEDNSIIYVDHESNGWCINKKEIIMNG